MTNDNTFKVKPQKWGLPFLKHEFKRNADDINRERNSNGNI
jgi:hypothetical protein